MALGGKGAEVRVGIVVLLGLAVLVVGLFLVSGGAEQFADKARYRILFTNSGGVGGGDAVFLAGQRVGSVIDVETTDVVEDGVSRKYVAVTIEVHKDAVLHRDSDVSVAKTVTGIVTLNIEYGESGEVLGEGEALRGRKLATFEEAIDGGAQLVEKAEGMLEEIRDKIAAIDTATLQQKADDLLTKLNRVADDLERIVANAEQPVADTLVHVRDAAEEAKGLVQDLRRDWQPIHEKALATLDRAKGAAGTLDTILAENREEVKAIVQTLSDASRRLSPALERAEVLLKEGHETIARIRPQLTAGVRSARSALDNFKALTEDLKTAPWKLVNKPSDRETEAVRLYNAAALYVTSVEQIRVLVDELDALGRLGALQEGESSEEVGALLAQLGESLRKFDASERELVRLMVASGGTAAPAPSPEK